MIRVMGGVRWTAESLPVCVLRGVTNGFFSPPPPYYTIHVPTYKLVTRTTYLFLYSRADTIPALANGVGRIPCFEYNLYILTPEWYIMENEENLHPYDEIRNHIDEEEWVYLSLLRMYISSCKKGRAAMSDEQILEDLINGYWLPSAWVFLIPRRVGSQPPPLFEYNLYMVARQWYYYERRWKESQDIL